MKDELVQVFDLIDDEVIECINENEIKANLSVLLSYYYKKKDEIENKTVSNDGTTLAKRQSLEECMAETMELFGNSCVGGLILGPAGLSTCTAGGIFFMGGTVYCAVKHG